MATKSKSTTTTTTPKKSTGSGYVPATGSTLQPAQSQAGSRQVAPQPPQQPQRVVTPTPKPKPSQGYVPSTGSTLQPYQPQSRQVAPQPSQQGQGVPGAQGARKAANQDMSRNPHANDAAPITPSSQPFNMSTTGQTRRKQGTVARQPRAPQAPMPSGPVSSVPAPYSPTPLGLPTTEGIPVWNQYVVPTPSAPFNQYTAGRPAPIWNQYRDKLDSQYWDNTVPQTTGTTPTPIWTQQGFEDWRRGERDLTIPRTPIPPGLGGSQNHSRDGYGSMADQGYQGFEVAGHADTQVTYPDGTGAQGYTDVYPQYGDGGGYGDGYGGYGGYGRYPYNYNQQVEDWFPGMMSWRF